MGQQTDHPIRKQDRKWLEAIRSATDAARSGRYPGMRVDHLPDSVQYRLRTRGRLIERWTPANHHHKDRWIITDAGRELLEKEA